MVLDLEAVKGLFMEMRYAVEQCVERLVRDLRDRRGLRQEWEKIDELTQEEIKREWVDIIIETISDIHF